MLIGVPVELAAGEARVAVTPETAKKLIAQGHAVRVQSGAEVLNFCANNYLGLSDHPAIIAAARESIRQAEVAVEGGVNTRGLPPRNRALRQSY